ncbi:MAG TPA: hypothetical protein VF228_00290 [Iamia sp.]
MGNRRLEPSVLVGVVLGGAVGAVIAIVIWFRLLWESEPCGATTCDNDGGIVVVVGLLAAVGALAGGWWAGARKRRWHERESS